MTYFAVIDTNVLVSAVLKWNSVPGTLMELVFSGKVVPLLCDQILGEYQEVLARPKFHLNEEIINNIIESIKMQGIYVNARTSEIDLLDPDDKIFYEVVLEKRKTDDAFLVTGNLKHFPSETFIISPREMLEILSAGL